VRREPTQRQNRAIGSAPGRSLSFIAITRIDRSTRKNLVGNFADVADSRKRHPDDAARPAIKYQDLSKAIAGKPDAN
jgi:hypothetical protein